MYSHGDMCLSYLQKQDVFAFFFLRRAPRIVDVSGLDPVLCGAVLKTTMQANQSS